jgi:hypothetical protein
VVDSGGGIRRRRRHDVQVRVTILGPVTPRIPIITRALT